MVPPCSDAGAVRGLTPANLAELEQRGWTVIPAFAGRDFTHRARSAEPIYKGHCQSLAAYNYSDAE